MCFIIRNYFETFNVNLFYFHVKDFMQHTFISLFIRHSLLLILFIFVSLKRGCHILVATPGRLLDFVERNRVSFDGIRFVVLDEADRMLDMGFMPNVEKMMDHPTMVPSVSENPWNLMSFVLYVYWNWELTYFLFYKLNKQQVTMK